MGWWYTLLLKMAANANFGKSDMGLPLFMNRCSSRSRLGTDSHSKVHLFERKLVVKASSVGRNDKM
jgi:hypothetical protein